MNTDRKILRNKCFRLLFVANRDKWQSKILFLTIFDPRSSIVLTFSIAAYQVCYEGKYRGDSKGICIRPNVDHAAQLHRLVRILKFGMEQGLLNYPASEYERGRLDCADAKAGLCRCCSNTKLRFSQPETHIVMKFQFCEDECRTYQPMNMSINRIIIFQDVLLFCLARTACTARTYKERKRRSH